MADSVGTGSSEIVLGAVSARPEDLDATYCLYTWNQADYVAQAVHSALSQAKCRLDLIISDDSSTDGTWERIVAAVHGYSGPHRVRVRRNERNLGIDHFPSLLKVAACEIAIHAHGDDVAEPARAATILRIAARTGASVVSSNATLVDAQGRVTGRLSKDKHDRVFTVEDLLGNLWQPQMTGALLAIRREVYTRFPWLDSRLLARGHDHLVPWRGALLNGFYWISESLLQHRMHEGQWRKRFWSEAGPEARRETVYAQHLSVGRARRRDIDHLLANASEPRTTNLVSIRNALDRRMASVYEEWLDMREDLIRNGRRPGWDVDEFVRPKDPAAESGCALRFRSSFTSGSL
jgi:hypothetical protein